MQKQVIGGTLPPCAYHRPVDWEAINNLAETIRDTARPWSVPTVTAAARKHAPDEETEIVVRGLFLEPITWDGKNTQFVNGQHRVCGLRAAGAARALVNTVT